MPNTNKLINVYHNSRTINALTLTIAHDTSSAFIVIAWQIVENFWYIPVIYDKNITGIDNNNEYGWYLDEIPTIYNLPVRHSKVDTINVVNFGKCLIIGINNTISNQYKFVVEMFISSLANDDNIKRNKFMQQSMISNICHSVRTPLNGILHMTNMLLTTDRIVRRSTLKRLPITNVGGLNKIVTPLTHSSISATTRLNNEHLTYLNQSAVTMANNIFDIIDMSQLSSGNLKINKSVFNIRELINQVIAVAKTLINNKKISLEFYIEQSVPEYAFSDMKRIKQILINLIKNAFHNTKKGEVSLYLTANLISLDDEDDILASYKDLNQYNLSFTVSDTGSGIDKAIVNKLFKPPELLIDSKQYGLGLRVSYQLANRLGGDLLLKNTSTCGSSFEFNIIIYEEQQPVFNSETLKSLKKKTVLLLDDSAYKPQICKVLRNCGMIYTVASSYDEILVLHHDKSFDLIICQTDLKSEDGATIAANLHAHYSSLFLAVADDITQLSDDIFHERISLPSENYTIKHMLTKIFNTKYDNINVKTKLLVVEDEPINRIIIEKLLRSVGYTCIDLASNGREALDMIIVNKYDLLLVDIRMPIMNGFELAHEVQKINPKPKIIGVTAQMLIESDPKELFDDFIYKPIDIDELNQKIQYIYST